jgi:hypothetical protein
MACYPLLSCARAIHLALSNLSYTPFPSRSTRRTTDVKQDAITRELLHEYLALLCREDRFRDTLLDPQHQYAFDCLLEDTWWPNEDTILSLGLPIMDTINLITSIHNQRRLAVLRQKLDDLISRLSPTLQARYWQRLCTLGR